MKESQNERRLKALYEYKANGNSKTNNELLNFLLAIIPHKTVKEVTDEFDIKY